MHSVNDRQDCRCSCESSTLHMNDSYAEPTGYSWIQRINRKYVPLEIFSYFILSLISYPTSFLALISFFLKMSHSLFSLFKCISYTQSHLSLTHTHTHMHIQRSQSVGTVYYIVQIIYPRIQVMSSCIARTEKSWTLIGIE